VLFKLTRLIGPVRQSTAKLGDLVRDLERKLLIHADQIHTDSGAHAKGLKHGSTGVKERKGFVRSSIKPDEAKRNLEERLRTLNEEFGGTARLPWA